MGTEMSKAISGPLLVLVLLAAGCGSGDDEVEPNAAGEVVLELSEYSFGADAVKVTAGQTVTFVLDNVGEKEHEFMIGRDIAKSDEGYADSFEHGFFEGLMPTVDPPSAAMGMDMDGAMEGMDHGDDDHGEEPAMEGMDHGDDEGAAMEGMDHGDDHGFMVMLEPGHSARVTVTIPDDAVGEWTIGCFEDKGAHWDSGMKAILKVTA